MNFLFVISFILSISGIKTFYLEEQILRYFNGAMVNRATVMWLRHMVAYENTISAALKENYGYKGLNIYVKKPTNPLHVGTGYYHTDNQVHLVLHDMSLEELPHLSDPLVRFPLLSNVLNIEAVVSRININANYIQFRNTSNIAYGLLDQNSHKMSPFLFEQVRSVGQLAITVEGCKVAGIGITSLTGRSVNLGNTVFRLSGCHYNFEIFTPGMSSPPVIADYLPNSEGLNLDNLIMKPLQAELMPKLQALLQTYVNTSSIFKEHLGEIRTSQSRVFEQVTNYANNVIRNLNVLTIMKNMGKIVMEDFSILWDDTFEDGVAESVLSLRNMVITGLETVYSSHTGGPFRLTTLKISEEFRYATLQVRGSIDMQVGESTKGMYEFAVEISDVSVDVTANLERKIGDTTVPGRSLHIIQVMGWRSAQFSCPGMTFHTGEAFIIGYLQTKVPIFLANHMNQLLTLAVAETDKEYASLGIGDTSDLHQTLGAVPPIGNMNAFPVEPIQPVPQMPVPMPPMPPMPPINDVNTIVQNNNINNGVQNPELLPNNNYGYNPNIENNLNNPAVFPNPNGIGNVNGDIAPSLDEDGDMAPREVPDVVPPEPQVELNGNPSSDQDAGGDDLQLHAKFFDENMFAKAQNPNQNTDNNPTK